MDEFQCDQITSPGEGCPCCNRAGEHAAEAEYWERKAKEAFTLEDLEVQVARTQGRGDGKGVAFALFASLEEEAREVAELFHLGPDIGVAEWREALKLELGDVLNVVTAITMHAGFSLREVAEANDAKMRARMPEGCGQ